MTSPERPAALALVGFPVPEGMGAMEAARAAGLDWGVKKAPMYVRTPYGTEYPVEGKFAVVREDTGRPLGPVGNRYTPYQNSEFFGFVERFCAEAGSRIDRCGGLREGRVVWASAKAGTVEYVPGDPVERWFVARNSHDGTTSVDITFSETRIVCGNMLSAAFRDGVYHVRHTSGVEATMRQIGLALSAHASHGFRLGSAMRRLAAAKVDERAMRELTRGLVAKDPDPDAVEDKRAYKGILELVESGLGSSIPGVRGTAYGWLHAVTEYVDHHRPVHRGERDPDEARFDAVVLGTGARFKRRAFEAALKMAA